MGESTGEENANLYIRGVNEGRSGELLEASELLDILEVFGEDGMRSYLVGFLEGEEEPIEPIRSETPSAREESSWKRSEQRSWWRRIFGGS